MMAITRNAEAFLARAPNPDTPKSRIVGNRIDIKKQLRKNAATDAQPSWRNTNRRMTLFGAAYQVSTLWAAAPFGRTVPVARPGRRQRKPADARFAAPLSLSARAPVFPAANQVAKRPEPQPAGTGGVCEVR